MSTAIYFYQEKENYYHGLVKKFSKKSKRTSLFRLIWFVLWGIAVWYATAFNIIIALSTIGSGLVGFIIIALYHSRILTKKRAYDIYRQINATEIKRLNHDYSGIDDGTEFINESHYFSHDLDVFGPSSLFQFINRCFSPRGKKQLANGLQYPLLDKKEIENVQNAVDELSTKVEWIQQFQVLGQLSQMKQHNKTDSTNNLNKWAKKRGIFFHDGYKIAVVVISLISWLMFAFFLYGSISSLVFMLYSVIPLGFSGYYAKKINLNHQELGKQSAALQKWKDVFLWFEKTNFKAPAIQDLQHSLLTNNIAASQAIKKLASLSQAFDNRLNFIGWVLLNYFFLWDIFQSIQLENWRLKHGEKVDIWFNSLANMEYLSSLAIMKHNHPMMIFPNIKSQEGFVYQATEAAHPLLTVKGRVSNDIEFSNMGTFAIVTGANMAGKSTYLRTVGINMILALAGAPVCAKTMTISPLQLFTSIRTKDSLIKNESYFYAELLRLQQMISKLKNGQHLFIILDEILKGTNSKDKQTGSKALVAQLIALQATGIIATHDLQLGLLAKSFPQTVKNICFEVDIHFDQLHFDYKLRKGISQNLNATFLMKKMGIIPN